MSNIRFVEPSAVYWNRTLKKDFVEEMKNIERAGRNCYQSTHKITEDSWKGFLYNLYKSGHLSVFEFGGVYKKRFDSGKFVTPEKLMWSII